MAFLTRSITGNMSKINELPVDRQRDEFMGLYPASQRAAHQILDNPKIFEEPLALRIIGAETESRLRLSLAQFQKPTERAFRAAVMVRNRYAEDELGRSIQRGVRQYVILGAGSIRLPIETLSLTCASLKSIIRSRR